MEPSDPSPAAFQTVGGRQRRAPLCGALRTVSFSTGRGAQQMRGDWPRNRNCPRPGLSEILFKICGRAKRAKMLPKSAVPRRNLCSFTSPMRLARSHITVQKRSRVHMFHRTSLTLSCSHVPSDITQTSHIASHLPLLQTVPRRRETTMAIRSTLTKRAGKQARQEVAGWELART